MLLKILNKLSHMLPKTLLGRLIILPSIMVFIIFLATTLIAIYFQYQSLNKSLIRHGSNLSKEISYSIQSYLLLSDYAAIESVMGRFLESENISSVSLINAEGNILIKIKKGISGERIKSYTIGKIEKNLKHKKIFYTENQKSIVFFTSIQMPDGIWHVNIDIDKREMYSSLVYLISFAGLLVLLFLIILSFIVVKILNKPIKDIENLTNFASKLSENIGEKIDINSNVEEIYALNEALNILSEKLYSNQKLMLLQQENLQQYNESLSEMVESETAKNRDKDALLVQQSRFVALGEMIGNIAHQWRQPLNAVALRVQDLNLAYHMNELDSSLVNEHVEQIMIDINSLSKTIDYFGDLVVSSNLDEVYSVNDVVNKTLEIMSYVFIEANINVHCFSNDESIISHKGSAQRLGQVIMALLTNSKDALISKENFSKDISIEVERLVNSRIKVKVKDNGNGIDFKNLDKIFDPYFTTKHQSDGTGLGLYIAKNIVENEMNGVLYTENIDYGICFIIEW